MTVPSLTFLPFFISLYYAVGIQSLHLGIQSLDLGIQSFVWAQIFVIRSSQTLADPLSHYQ